MPVPRSQPPSPPSMAVPVRYQQQHSQSPNRDSSPVSKQAHDTSAGGDADPVPSQPDLRSQSPQSPHTPIRRFPPPSPPVESLTANPRSPNAMSEVGSSGVDDNPVTDRQFHLTDVPGTPHSPPASCPEPSNELPEILRYSDTASGALSPHNTSRSPDIPPTSDTVSGAPSPASGALHLTLRVNPRPRLPHRTPHITPYTHACSEGHLIGPGRNRVGLVRRCVDLITG